MSWSHRYWDVFHHLYWSPENLALHPLPAEIDDSEPAFVKIPKKYLDGGRRLRYRTEQWDQTFERLSGDEHTLNSFFDITFSIAPDSLISRWFAHPLGIIDSGPFENFGLLQATERYQWGSKNVFQHDGVFASPASIICTEIKLKSPTSTDQVLKYISLFMLEEKLTGSRQNLGLLYVVPEYNLTSIKSKVSSGMSDGCKKLRDDLTSGRLKNPHVREILSDGEHFSSVLARMRWSVISWSNLYDQVVAEQKRMDERDPSQQTLHRLLSGFADQLRAHRHTGVRP